MSFFSKKNWQWKKITIFGNFFEKNVKFSAIFLTFNWQFSGGSVDELPGSTVLSIKRWLHWQLSLHGEKYETQHQLRKRSCVTKPDKKDKVDLSPSENRLAPRVIEENKSNAIGYNYSLICFFNYFCHNSWVTDISKWQWFAHDILVIPFFTNSIQYASMLSTLL